MGVAILYGIYDFYIAPRSKSAASNPAKKAAELEAFISDVTSKIGTVSPSSLDTYAISLAEAEWKRDPFYGKKSFRDWEMRNEPKAGSGTVAEPAFSYSGYLRFDKKEMAIINGVEYETGNNLENEGFVLEKIFPDRVVVLNKKNRSRAEIPLIE